MDHIGFYYWAEQHIARTVTGRSWQGGSEGGHVGEEKGFPNRQDYRQTTVQLSEICQ